MNIFDYIISEKVIAGISELHTHFDEGMSTKRYWFQLYTVTQVITINSDTFDAGDRMAAQRDAWLQRFDAVKEKISRLVDGPAPEYAGNVNDTFNALLTHINEALKLLEPRSDGDKDKVQSHTDRVFTNARKLKDLALA